MNVRLGLACAGEVVRLAATGKYPHTWQEWIALPVVILLAFVLGLGECLEDIDERIR